MSAVVTFLFVTLPWLNPFSPGPTPAVLPLLFSWVCAALVGLALIVARRRGSSQSLVRALALAWLVAASLSALIGLLQYFGATAWAGPWLNHTGIGEAYGNLRQRNQFATLMNIGLVALLWMAATLPATPKTEVLHLPMLLLTLIAALIGAGNAASSSRTGLMQLVPIAALTWVWQHQTKLGYDRRSPLRPVNQIILTSLLAYAIATVVLPILAGIDPSASGAWARLRSGDALCTSRLTLWRNVLYLIAQKPWLGWGWGELDYAHFITLYPGARFCDILDNAHNLPLHLAVELGVPVAVLACGLVGYLVWHARPWREVDASRQMAWGVLSVIGLHSLLEYPLWYGPFQMATLASIWLLCRRNSTFSSSFRPVALYLQALSAIILIALCIFLAWNYQLTSQIYLPPESRMRAYQDDTQNKIKDVRYFQDQIRFADLTTTDLSTENANAVNTLAVEMLHFSPEARVVELVLQSARLANRTDQSIFYATRYQAAFPVAYTLWEKKAQNQ